MNVEAIDWGNAPEGAGYYLCPYFYKVENETAYFWDEDYADWRESSYYSSHVEERFTSRPISANQKVSTSVEIVACTETKPPLGLMPKVIWEEQMQHQRRQDIHAAMQRYIEAGKDIPNNWLEELLELNNAIAIIRAQDVLATVKQNIKEEMDVEQPDNSNGGWIEWGKEEEPNISDYATVEKVYSDGDTRTGYNSAYMWFGSPGRDGKPYVVTRYRIINEETE